MLKRAAMFALNVMAKVNRLNVLHASIQRQYTANNKCQSPLNKNYTILRSNEAFDVAWDMMKSVDKGDNAPTNPGLWSQAKSKARSKFKVYPSAYANAWASKWYKGKGGGWKKKGKKK